MHTHLHLAAARTPPQNGERTLPSPPCFSSSQILLVRVYFNFYSPARLPVAPRDLNRMTSQPGQNKQQDTKWVIMVHWMFFVDVSLKVRKYRCIFNFLRRRVHQHETRVCCCTKHSKRCDRTEKTKPANTNGTNMRGRKITEVRNKFQASVAVVALVKSKKILHTRRAKLE